MQMKTNYPTRSFRETKELWLEMNRNGRNLWVVPLWSGATEIPCGYVPKIPPTLGFLSTWSLFWALNDSDGNLGSWEEAEEMEEYEKEYRGFFVGRGILDFAIWTLGQKSGTNAGTEDCGLNDKRQLDSVTSAPGFLICRELRIREVWDLQAVALMVTS